MKYKTTSTAGSRLSWHTIAPIFAVLILFVSVTPDRSHAAVTTSITQTTGGGNLNTTITQNGNMYNITGGTRPGCPAACGTNLFHSFGNFSVGAGDIANFLNNTGLPTSNILGRVTGGSISNIFGIIQTTGFGNANLFLMNPAGFLFGPGAQVNVGGMVAFTTADYIRLNDNARFNAAAGPADLLLTAAPVAAFGFLGSNAAAIAIQGGTLEVANGKTLSFIGGPNSFTTDSGVTVPSGVSMTGGSLSAPNGLIYMATVTSPGEVPLPTLSGAPSGALGPPAANPAVIRIRSGEFVMDNASLIATNPGGTAQPPIDVNIQGTMVVRNGSSISSNALGAGPGSDVLIAAQSLQMDGSTITTTAQGTGPSGSVSIAASDTASFTNSNINTSVFPANGVSQNAGSISVMAAQVNLQNSMFQAEVMGDGLTAGNAGAVTLTATGGSVALTGSSILTDSNGGNGGAVTITATDTASFTSATILTSTSPANGISQNAGPISVTASQVSLQDSLLLTFAIGDGVTAGNGGAVTLTGTGDGGSVTLTGSTISTAVLGNGNGGAVTMTAPVVTLQNSSVVASQTGDGIDPTMGSGGAVTLTGTTSVSITGSSSIDTSTSETAGNSGKVTISAPTVMFAGTGSLGEGFIVTSTSVSQGSPNSAVAGNAGDIEITGTNITLTNVAQLQSFADSPGTFSRGGDIRINGTESILVSNGSTLLTSTTSQAKAGDIQLGSKHVTITGQSTLSSDTFGPGSAGTVTITGTESIALGSGSIISTSSVFSGDVIDYGPAGSIALNTPHLTITGGSLVRSQTDTSGPAGTITVQGVAGPAASVLINGTGSAISTDVVGISLGNIKSGTGAGGDIVVTANQVTLSNGGILSGTTSGTAPTATGGKITVKANQVQLNTGGSITASTTGAGTAGAVTIQGLASPAQSVLIDGAGSGISTDTHGTGTGGDISINANTVTMTSGATITADSTGTANAGNINVTAINGLSMQNSSITTLVPPSSTGNNAGGGDIKITTSPAATVYLQDSTISASVADGHGGGGNISIDPQFVILQNSQILAQAAQGQGGAITIIAGLFLSDATSKVNADSGSGQNGTITIQSPIAPASGRILPLPQKPLIATTLLSQRCAALAGGNFSSFTVAGRDSLPAEPGGWLSSPLALTSLSAGTEREVSHEGQESMAQGASPLGETPLLSLRQIAPPGFLTQAFAADWSAGCTS